MRTLKAEHRVTEAVARERALAYLRTHSGAPPSWIANVVWPGNDMTPQGAALAVAAILKRMEDDGLVIRLLRGWSITSKGRMHEAVEG